MGSLTIEVTDEGILIPSAAAQLLGCHAGGWAEVDVRPLPSPEELKDRALYYTGHRLGDAVVVGEPVWVGDGWELPLGLRGREGTYGHLFLTPDGEVIEARSSSRMELLEAANAASPTTTPAR